MSDLRDLYQEVILEHSRSPRNCRRLEGATRTARGINPLCGDHLVLYLRLDGDTIADIAFEGSGCAISKASTSMMTEALKGKTAAEAQALFAKFHKMVTALPGAAPPGIGPPGTGSGGTGPPGRAGPEADIGKLAVFAGVAEFPVRVKCATLPWHTLRTALDGGEEPATTE
jgi:nitrogen fixation NifU-like protein